MKRSRFGVAAFLLSLPLACPVWLFACVALSKQPKKKVAAT
jgi:hypothetical protein